MFVCLWLELCNAWGVMTQIIYRWSRMILLPGFTQASHPSVPSVKKHTCLMYVLVYICMCIYIYVYIHIIHTLYIYIYMLVLHILYINGPIDMDNLMDTLDGWMDGWIDTAPATPGSAFAFSATAMVAALALFSGSGCVRRLKRWRQAKVGNLWSFKWASWVGI